jgi:hypothetical protein
MTDSTSALLEGGAAPAAPAAPPAGDVPANVQAQVDAGKPPVAGTVPWLGEVDADTLGYVQNKGWTDPKALLEGYRSLEKMRGVPAERLLTLPAADADQAARDAFYDKLGRPKTAADYDFKLGDETLTGQLKTIMHKHGLTAEQARGVTADFGAFDQGVTEAKTKAVQEQVAADHTKIMAEWGAAADHNLQAAKKGREILGWKPEIVDAISGVLGHYNTVKLLHSIAERSGEAGFVADTSPGAHNAKMTPEQARNAYEQLRADPAWVKRYASGDVAAANEKRRLDAFMAAGR